jgi:perosamine synthetase
MPPAIPATKVQDTKESAADARMADVRSAEIFIPVCEPVLDGREREYVLDCLDGNWVSSLGKYIPQFENTFSQYCGVPHGVACSSGTAAIHLALESLGIGSGDEVIIPAFTLIVSANMVTLCGASPVLVDVQPDTWCIDPERIEERITSKTKAIMVVHMYGHPCDMDAIMAIARRHGLSVIEDCAQAHGAEVNGQRVGSIGDVGVFSFYGNKLITTGEGGMLVTRRSALATRAALLRNQAFTEERFVHDAMGFNYRMTNVQAAIGLAQCEKLDEKVRRKISMAGRYDALLGGVDGLTLPVRRTWAKNVYWMYGVVLDPSFGVTAGEIRGKLAERGVDTRGFFVPMNLQPLYQGGDLRYADLRGRYRVSERLCDYGFYLPSGLNLSPEHQEYVVEQLADCRD